ncbi:HIPL1 protein isoform X1 [Amaranthus tricolor]|uniref:HIPL1 protein isoform X1 n=2 Tax=Amaranthus tricolor TaxID=29722 RepID=UPI00258F6761|nr:HIPL1 protein isoform X1 [Amaranthus tricolor]
MGFPYITISFYLFSLLCLADNLSSHPLCVDSSFPITLKKPLKFCPYNGSSCCNSTQDVQLQKEFQSMNISDPACASVVKSVLCAKCDQFSAELFRTNSAPRSVPVLCNSTMSLTSPQSDQAANNFCSKVWDTCMNVSVLNSPFAPSLLRQAGSSVDSNQTKITDMWQSKTDFCKALGQASSDGLLCFSGEPVSLNNTSETLDSPAGLCLEKIGNGSYLSMVPHPDGSDRAFFSNQQGKIWLATLPREGSAGVIELDESSPFLDLSDIVHFDAEFGLMSIAVHPRFTDNGRFFTSFNCDKTKWAGCEGRCACNSDVNCDPSKLPPDNGAQTCQYHSVVAEFTVGDTKSNPSMATSASPIEVRRIFTMGLPFTSHHGGQILFGPDGYLYFMMGDGGGKGDPYNFSQNLKSLLGKIMRFDVNNFPSAAEISTEGLWGNYSIPKDNPYINDNQSQPEIWAIGLRNPWRCSFDAERSSYFMCTDVGQDKFEEVNIITKGGNYGWRAYEGRDPFTPQTSPGGNTSLNSINPIFPVMGYNHSSVSSKEGSASITGGYFYRSETDPCMYGRYLYADLYGGAIWEGTEFPKDSGNFTTSLLPFSCASDSPIKCSSVPGSSRPALGYVFSFGEDLKKNVYVLTSNGVYRVVRPSRCKYTCSKENTVKASNPSASPPSSTSPSHAIRLSKHIYISLILVLSLALALVV